MNLIFKLIEYSGEISFWFGLLDWLVRLPEAKIQPIVLIEKKNSCVSANWRKHNIYMINQSDHDSFRQYEIYDIFIIIYYYCYYY